MYLLRSCIPCRTFVTASIPPRSLFLHWFGTGLTGITRRERWKRFPRSRCIVRIFSLYDLRTLFVVACRWGDELCKIFEFRETSFRRVGDWLIDYVW